MELVLATEFYLTNPGPVDDCVLYDQENHVSAAIWEGQERGALRCHEHTSKLDRWMLTKKQIELVRKAGFGYLRLIPAISLDNPLISALVERWRRETNTFHFSVGEMTITLEDVAYLIGLPIDGEPVIGVTYTTCHAVCVKYLGRAPDPGCTSGGMVKLSWLKETFSHCPHDASIKEVECYTRAYLLYLVGSTIFSTTTGNKVPVMYLPLFEDFEEAGKYSWGSAALSFLYRALGNASLRSQSTISGCLTLLQCWSYYHLDIGRPRLHHDPIHECFPFVLRWKGKTSGPTSNRDVAYYRKALDSLTPADVDWSPYANVSRTVIPENILSSLSLGRSMTMLVCFDKAERHLPNRCLKQFGMPQTIPDNVKIWERKTRGVDGGVDLITKMESEVKEWSTRQFNIVEAEEDAEESDYMQWYMRITRSVVGRPVPVSSQFQRMSAALRNIEHLADTISTDGMDYRQIQTVSRIRYIVHDCLTDQVESSPTVPSPHSDLEKKVGKGKGRRKRRKKDNSEDCASLVAVEREKGTQKLKKKANSEYRANLVAVEHMRHRMDFETDHPRIFPPPMSKDAEPINFAANVDGVKLHNASKEVCDADLHQKAEAVDKVELSQGASKDRDPKPLSMVKVSLCMENTEDVLV